MSDGRIFISYRRGAENGDARALHVELEKHIDRSRIFMDVDSIPPGVDFHEFLERQVAECEVLLAVIGPGWHSQIARLQDPDDVVRIEIAAALRRPGLRVVPVLIDDAAMPRTEDLPESLRPLTLRQNVTLRHEDRYSDTVAWFARQLSPSGQGPSPPLGPEEPNQNAKRGDVTRRAAIWGSVAAIAGLGYVVANRDDLSGRPSRTAGPPSPEVVASAPADAVAPPPPEPEWLASGFGRETVRLEGHSGWVGSIAFSPDRHGLVSGGADGTIRRWDTVTGLQTAELQGHRRAVYSVAFAPDGRSLASGSDDSTVRLWDAGTGQEIAQLRGHQAAVNSVAFAPDGGLLASGG
ncbi:MAG: TIR domain-containing protein, partial [Pseudomonadota bacterium]